MGVRSSCSAARSRLSVLWDYHEALTGTEGWAGGWAQHLAPWKAGHPQGCAVAKRS